MNLDESELMAIAKVKQRTKLIAWLRRNRIEFKYTADEKHVWTTQHQIEKSYETKLEVVRIGKTAEKAVSAAS